jgi:hypothetical protein
MISVTSTTDRYSLQPSVLAKHKKIQEWISATLLWKLEVSFFQKILDQYASKFVDSEDKKTISHFQSIITYYRGELIDVLAASLRAHEKDLAEALENRDETKTQYFTQHDALMSQLESAQIQFTQYKEDFFRFIEKAM